MNLIQKVAMNHMRVAGVNDGLTQIRAILASKSGFSAINLIANVLITNKMNPILMDYALSHLKGLYPDKDIFHGFAKLNTYYFMTKILTNSPVLAVFRKLGLKIESKKINKHNKLTITGYGNSPLKLGNFETGSLSVFLEHGYGGEMPNDKVAGAELTFDGQTGRANFNLGIKSWEDGEYYPGIDFTTLFGKVRLVDKKLDVVTFYKQGGSVFNAYLEKILNIKFKAMT